MFTLEGNNYQLSIIWTFIIWTCSGPIIYEHLYSYFQLSPVPTSQDNRGLTLLGTKLKQLVY